MGRHWWWGGLAVVAMGGGLTLFPFTSSAASREGRPIRSVPVTTAPGLTTRSRLVRLLPDKGVVEAAIGLRPRHEKALRTFLQSVTTPGSTSYHHYLTEEQFVARYGPRETTIRQVTSLLRRDGLQPGAISANHLLVTFRGSVAATERAFRTPLALFALPGGGVGQATTRSVRLPHTIAAHVAVVAGLDNLVHPVGLLERGRGHRAAGTVPFARVAGAPDACPVANGTATRLGGLTDDEIAHAYGAFGLYRADDTGQRESIAVYELEPFARTDIATFDACYFGAGRARSMADRLHVVAVDGGVGVGYGSGEAALDVEDVSAIAPGARVDVFEAPDTTFGSLDDYNAIVSADSDEVVTTSWGLCETAIQQGSPGIQQEEDFIFEEAAAQGQTVVAAAGDSGSDDCNTDETNQPVHPLLSVDDPGSQPYVLSAGGTTVLEASDPPVEQVWDDGASAGAGGGGVSNSWLMPSWQRASRVPDIDPGSVVSLAEHVEGDHFCAKNADGSSYGGAMGEPCREVPDVSADADQFTGAITQFSGGNGAGAGGWTTIGGTSSSAPLWAAMLTLVNASPACHGEDVPFARGEAPDIGFASPLLYAVASNPSAYATSFTDVTRGSNDLYGLGDGSLFKAAKGFDMASGLGTPELTSPDGGDGLAYYLCALGQSAERPSVTSLDPPLLATDTGGASITVSGTGFMRGGRNEVAAIRLGDFLVPKAEITVKSATELVLSDLPPAHDLLPVAAAGDGAGPAPLTVTVDDGASSAPGPDSVLQLVDEAPSSDPVPAVSGVSPYGGPDSGGGTVTIFGSGFVTGDTVSFGGVGSPRVRVESPFEIAAEAPAYRAGSTTCATPLRAMSDLCQTEVVVANTNGASAGSKILRPYEGTLYYNRNGVVVPPRGCGCEISPALSEYDYFPRPHISSVSTSQGADDYASEAGGSTVTIAGSGLDFFGMEGVVLGPISRYSGLNYSNISYDTATRLQLLAPSIPTTPEAHRLAARVETLGGFSTAGTVTYAGVPRLASLTPHLAADSGGTRLVLRGRGLGDSTSVQFIDSVTYSIDGSVYSFAARSQGALVIHSPAENPGHVLVEVCTTSGCSSPTKRLSMTLYPAGGPFVSSLRPRAGPARGGTIVTVRGDGLGCVVAVYFGARRAPSSANEGGILGCGSETVITAIAPPGPAGETIPVTVETAESAATGGRRSPATPASSYTYAPSSPSSPRLVHVQPGAEAIGLSWKPPVSDGGFRITGYTVVATARGLPFHRLVLDEASRHCRLAGLYAGAVWTVTVVALNRLGAGTPAVARAMPHVGRSKPAVGSARTT